MADRVKPAAWFKFGVGAGVDLDISGNQKLKAAYEKNEKAQATAKAAREELEALLSPAIVKAMKDQIPEDHVPIFGYRFGPSFGFVPSSDKTTRGRKPRLALKV